MSEAHPFVRKARHAFADRAGVSLIEAVAVVAVGALLTGTVVAAMGMLFQYDQHMRAHTQERDQLQFLVRQLRSDIREATKCHFDTAEKSLMLEGDGGQAISYSWFETHVERTSGAGGVASTSRYLVPHALQVAVSPVEASRGHLVRIQFSTDDAVADGTRSSSGWNFDVQVQVGSETQPQGRNQP